MKRQSRFIFCGNRFIIAALLAALTSPTRAQSDAAPVSNSLVANASAFDEGTLVPRLKTVVLPALVRRNLPRGAQTVFCVEARVENRAVLLHGWNNSKGDTTLDILVKSVARRSVRKSKSSRRALASFSRLKRVKIGRIAPNQVVVRALPLKTGSRGWVVSFEWSESQSAGAFMTVPMLAVTFPNGSGGAAIFQDFSTESSAGGNVFYLLCKAQNGEAFLLLTNEAFDAGTKSLGRTGWNGRKFEKQGESVTRPLETSK